MKKFHIQFYTTFSMFSQHCTYDCIFLPFKLYWTKVVFEAWDTSSFKGLPMNCLWILAITTLCILFWHVKTFNLKLFNRINVIFKWFVTHVLFIINNIRASKIFHLKLPKFSGYKGFSSAAWQPTQTRSPVADMFVRQADKPASLRPKYRHPSDSWV